MELDELLAQIRDVYLSDRKVAFYGAAGISKNCPTHLPLGGELGQAIISGFLETQSAEDLTLLGQLVKKRTLEEVCGVIQNELEHKESLVIKMAQVLGSEEILPNALHRFLARTLHDGHLVITTNYESLIERAYRDLYKTAFPTERICYDKDTFTQFLSRHSNSAFERDDNEPGWLLKLHGSFRLGDKDVSHSVMTTLQRVGQGLPPTAREALIQVLQNCPLVVLGYGCMDIDIVHDVLVRTSSSQPIWWIKHNLQETHVHDYSQLTDLLASEKTKKTEDIEVSALNVASVLCTRGQQNGGIVCQINAHTSHVMLSLMGLLGGYWGTSVELSYTSMGRHERWVNELRQFGVGLSEVERLMVLAKLAQACGPKKAEGRDIYDLSNDLFKKALEEARDDIKKARIHQEMAWNKYRQDPERNTDQVIKLCDQADMLLPKGIRSWMLRVNGKSLCTLAYRRARQVDKALMAAEEICNSLPVEVLDGDLPPETLLSMLGDRIDAEKGDLTLLGSLLRRVAGVYDQCVSGPDTLSTAMCCKYQWKMHDREIEILRRARRLLEMDLKLQQLSGEPVQKIQTENQLGLVCSKLGEFTKANTLHEDSCRVAHQLGRMYEYAQALRNRGLAEEGLRDLDKAISTMDEALQLFKNRPAADDAYATLWHLGRIRIKNRDDRGLEDVEKHLANPKNNWHWKANDYALLAIGYFDIKHDPVLARQYFSLMMDQYPRKDGLLDMLALKNQAYGVDNALANVLAATERLSTPNGAGVELCARLALIRKQLETFRLDALDSLKSVL
jgi:tetratricopeptide (TPR) repeat protein